jgi:hypothetical protein
LEKGGGCVTVLLPLPLLYVRLLLTLAPPISLSSCFVLSCLAGYRTLNFLLCEIPLPTLHCDHGDCVSSERLAATKTKGEWMEAQTMAGLGTSACSGGCSDTGVTVKSWCRIVLAGALDLRW